MKSLISLSLFFCLVSCSPPDRREQVQPSPAPPNAETGTSGTKGADPQAQRITGPILRPVDEGASDPSFAAFRADLLESVRQRDAQRLIAALDPNIRTSFGGGGRIAGFRQQFAPEKNDSAVWPELETILTNGGTFLEGSNRSAFWAPYVYSAWPDGFDAFEYAAILGENVPLRDSASDSATTLGLLSHNIVKLSGEEEAGFSRVQVPDGRSGWVRSDQMRRPIDFRAGFNKLPSGWKMTGLVAGD